MSNCLFEATLQAVEEICNCTPKIYLGIVEGYEACEGSAKKCMNQLILEMGDKRSIMDRGKFLVGFWLSRLLLMVYHDDEVLGAQ